MLLLLSLSVVIQHVIVVVGEIHDKYVHVVHPGDQLRISEKINGGKDKSIWCCDPHLVKVVCYM